MRTGEAPALTQQGEADSLQSGSCAGFTAQDASPYVLRLNSKEHRNEMSRTFYRSGN